MKIKDVVIPNSLLPDKLTLCLLQLRSPFFQEAGIIHGSQQPFMGWIGDAHRQRENRLKNCLDAIYHFDRHVDMVVLPEYAVSEDMLDLINQFCLKNRTVVIGTFYDAQSRVAKTFAAIPGQSTCDIETGFKYRRSKHDTDVLEELDEENKHLLRLRWSVQQQEISLLVLSCIDFLGLGNLPEEIKYSDIVVSPMCTNQVNLFYNTAENAIRWFRPNTTTTRSRVCVLCNSVDLSGGGVGSCGESQVVGPYRGLLPKIPIGGEGGLVVNIDCLRLLTIPTPTTGEDRVVIEAPATFSLDSEWRVQWFAREEIPRESYQIHPNMPFRLLLHKYYYFFRMRDYHNQIEHLKNAPIGVAAVFGFHDVVMFSFEDSLQSFMLRLDAWFPTDVSRSIEKKGAECIEVVRILKHRGHFFGEVDPSKSEYAYYRPDLLPALQEKDMELTFQHIRTIMSGNELPVELKENLIQKSVLLDNISRSDVTTADMIQEKSEFLVLVFLLEGGEGQNPTRIFEEHVIRASLEQDDRVKTIEVCERTRRLDKGLLRAHYILHIVGHLRDLREIILEKIHSKLSQFGLGCGSRVVPVALPLCGDPSMWVSETPLWDPVTRQNIQDIIEEVVGEISPFVIKKLDRQNIALLSSIWHKANCWMGFREAKGVQRVPAIKNTRHQLARCLYFISYSLDQEEQVFTEEILSNMWSYCGGFYHELAGEVEGFLKVVLSDKHGEYGDGFETRLKAASEKVAKEKAVEFDLKKMSMGNLMQSIIFWNTTVDEEECIISKEFGKKIQMLQRYGFDDFRNCFAHSVEKIPQAISAMREHLNDKKGAKRLLRSIEEGLGLLLSEKYDQ